VATLPESVVRARLCRAQRELAEIGGDTDVETVLDIIETVPADRFGWQYPEPLTAHDRAFLAQVGAL
jgi:hypothetical protein